MEEEMVVTKAEELVDLPPGFRFHPTDEEIITCYLTEKVMNNKFSAVAIGEADLNKCEPWDLHTKAKLGENEWYFFCQKDRKYPTGMRTNRATESGYWKATGKDKEIFRGKGCLVGMKKTLVFYKGRAPKGEKTNWVMHEYRLEGNLPYIHNLSRSSKDEWVVCRVHHKTIGAKKNPVGDHFLRMNSFDDVGNFLDYSSLPPLMDPSFSGRPGPSSSAEDPLEFKPMTGPPPPPPPRQQQTPQPQQTINQNYIYHPNTNLPQSSISAATMFNPQIPFQNPISSFNGAIRGSGFGEMGPKSNEVVYKVEQISSTQSGLSADVNYNTAEISSKQKNIIGNSKSYEDFADLGNIWDY